MGMYDEVARHAGKLDGFVLFQWIGRRDPFLAYSFDSWEDARRISLPGQPDRTNDLVALLQPQDPNRPPAWGIVEVQAELTSQGRSDELLERLVTRLGVESEVIGVRWEIPSTEENGSHSFIGGAKPPFG